MQLTFNNSQLTNYYKHGGCCLSDQSGKSSRTK